MNISLADVLVNVDNNTSSWHFIKPVIPVAIIIVLLPMLPRILKSTLQLIAVAQIALRQRNNNANGQTQSAASHEYQKRPTTTVQPQKTQDQNPTNQTPLSTAQAAPDGSFASNPDSRYMPKS